MKLIMQKVYSFWFHETSPEKWFNGGDEFDELLKHKFSDLVVQAAAGELYKWRSTTQGRLTEIIVLDQFTRNIYRGTPAAFACDGAALALAQEAVSAGILEQLESEDQRKFLLMPYMHSESKLIHEVAEPLFKKYTSAQTYEYEIRHKVIVDRFGRYPHRNAILNRESSAEEIEFLKQPDSSF